MYKNQLQEFAQRSCINLPSYSCIREGPDHAPRFKARVNFNGEVFESPSFCSTLRQAEHAAAELALITLSQRGPSRVLATRVLDETGVYKNLLQETAHRAGMKLPAYTTVRTGPGYAPVFTCTVELAGMSFSGEQARTKKQAQKSAAMVAWFSLKELSKECSSSHHQSSDLGKKEEQEQVIVARYLSRIKLPDTRKPVQREKRRTQKEFSPVKGNNNNDNNILLPYSFGWSSDNRMPHQNYASSYLSPEYTMYHHQTWHQGGVPIPSTTHHLLALPSASSSSSSVPTPSPGLFPLIQSIIRPEMSTVFVTRDQELLPLAPRTSPFFYLSDNLLPPVLDRSGSHVTIEEIEDNSQQLLNKGISSVHWRSSSNSNTCDSSHHPLSFNHASATEEQMQPEITAIREEEKEKKDLSSDAKTVQDKGLRWLKPGFIRNRGSVTDSPATEPPRLRPGNLLGTSAFRPNVSARYLPEGMRSHPRRMPCASQIAPAVQIRSVMPVCSSPVRRTSSSSIQTQEGKTKPEEESREETITGMNSEFCRLQL